MRLDRLPGCGIPDTHARHFFHHLLTTALKFILTVGEARPDVRVRVRGSVIRIHVGDTAVRIRIVVRAVDHAGASACLYLLFVF